MSSSNQQLESNITVKKEKSVDKNWGGIPPSFLREDSSGKSINNNQPTFNHNQQPPASSQPVPKADVSCVGGENEVPPVDSNSIQGKFGWTKVNNVDIPYLLRGTEHFVSVRMIELKLLKTYFETLPMQLFTIARVNSEYVTANEAALLNEINIKHCECKFGKTSFSRYDLIVQEDAVKEMCEFLNNCHLISIGASDQSKALCGLLKIENVTMPYVIFENSQWVPFDMVPSANRSSCAIQTPISKWQLGYLKFCSIFAEIDDSVITAESKIVRVQDVTSVDSSTTHAEELSLSKYVKLQSLPSYSTTNGQTSKNVRVNGAINHQQQHSWMMNSVSNNNNASSHILSTHQRQSPVAPASKSMYLPPYSPNSPLLAPSPQQLSPSVEPVGTPPYSHHMSHPNSYSHHVPSVSLSTNNSAYREPSTYLLYESLQSRNRLSKNSPQESQSSISSSSSSDILHKRTHISGQTAASAVHPYNRLTSNRNAEYISLPSSYVQMDELSAQPKKSFNHQPQLQAQWSFIDIPDPIQLDESLPPYSVSQVKLEYSMLPAINSKAYVYNDSRMIPLVFVCYKLFPDSTLQLFQQTLMQVFGVNIFTANKYMSETLAKVCRLPHLERKISLIRWSDLKSIFGQLKLVLTEMARKNASSGGNNFTELQKHLQSMQLLNKAAQMQTCNR